MKRKASSESLYPGLVKKEPNKRAKLDSDCYSPIDIPEIFAHILSYLIFKPRYAINFAKVSTKCYANMHNTSVWKQIGFNIVLSNDGRLDNNVLAVMLQKLENNRLKDKHIKTYLQLVHFDRRRDKRRQHGYTSWERPGEEAIQFGLISKSIDERYGISKSLPVPFYEQVLTNKLLSDSIIQAIADVMSNTDGYDTAIYEHIPVLFRAFEYVLGSSKSDLEHEAEREDRTEVPRLHVDAKGDGTAFPMLTKVQPDDATMTALQALLFSDTFLVFNTESYGRNPGNYSCFFRYCCSDMKAVVFDVQDYDESGTMPDYYKVNLASKSIESCGSLTEFMDEDAGALNGSLRVTQALINLFELSVREEDLRHICIEAWLRCCAVSDDIMGLLVNPSELEVEDMDGSESEE